MQTKDYSITLDMIRTLPFRPFEVVEGDTGNVLHVTLLNDGDPVALDGCNIQIAFASSIGFAIQDETSGIQKTAQAGTFDLTLYPTAYGAGNVSADVQVYSGTDAKTLITSTRFDFRCRKSLISGDIIRANTAYPPLVEAARVANEAAASALAAAARVDTDIGELNVQADWNEQDDTQDAFIRNKPTIPVVAGNVGAPLTHATRHAANDEDAVSPASILAAGKSTPGNGDSQPEQLVQQHLHTDRDRRRSARSRHGGHRLGSTARPFGNRRGNRSPAGGKPLGWRTKRRQHYAPRKGRSAND